MLKKKEEPMNLKSGQVLNLAGANQPVPGCTISDTLSKENGYFLMIFSLAPGTDISAETYHYPKIWYILDGEMTVTTPTLKDRKDYTILHKGDLYITPLDVPCGSAAEKGCVYLELTLKEDTAMNQILKSKEVFALKDLIPYQDGKIVNMDLINDEHLKFVIMSFGEGTALPEHAAPGEALIFALDGSGIIGYEGKEYPIHAGENFKFDKGGAHYVKADGKFKMALLLTLQ